jgi:trehalose synthase
MAEEEAAALLAAAGLTPGRGGGLPERVAGYAASRVRVLQDEPLPPGAPVVLQLSRWDPLKDMAGVLAGFAEHVAPHGDAHLVLAGPDPDDIPDDPENRAVFDEVLARHRALPPLVRRRVHLLVLGLADDEAETEANALVVNALQRRAAVVVQKSLREGFGLSVTEAMWKRRPVVAGAVGGIREQVADGVHALLLRDPADLAAFGAATTALLRDRRLRERLVDAAERRCRERFLVQRELADYARLYLALTGDGTT